MIHSKPCSPEKWKSWPKVIEASSHRLEKWCDTIFWFYPGGSVSPNNEVENPCRRKGSLSKFCLGFPRQEYSFLLLVNINDTKRIIICDNYTNKSSPSCDVIVQCTLTIHQDHEIWDFCKQNFIKFRGSTFKN